MSTFDCKPGQHPTRTGRVQPQADYRITLDGRDLSRLIAPNLISLQLTESRADEADTLELTVDDTRNTFAIPLRGANIEVSIGWVGEPLVDKGKFTVDTVEHTGAPDTIRITARSASMTNGMQERREKSWHQQTIGAIVQTIAARHGLKTAIDATLAQILIEHIDQTHESDLSFLTRLAKRYDAVMTVKTRHLLFLPIGGGKTASGRPLDVLPLTRASGDQHHYKIEQRDSYAAVRANYHSNGKAQRKSVVVGDEKGKNTKVLPQDYATEAEARAAAQAEFRRIQRLQATMTYALALGRPELFPEMPVTVSGFKPEIDDTPWLVKKATHKFADTGFTTELELEVRDDSKNKQNMKDKQDKSHRKPAGKP